MWHNIGRRSADFASIVNTLDGRVAPLSTWTLKAHDFWFAEKLVGVLEAQNWTSKRLCTCAATSTPTRGH